VERWRTVIERVFHAHHLIRILDASDVVMLAKVAGFIKESGTVLVVDKQQWDLFGEWYISYLRIFRCHQKLWVKQHPLAICGFAVDRNTVELLLQPQPVGTFLVRPSLSLMSCMVISAVIEGPEVKHLAINREQLERRSLEVWIRDVPEAKDLLDVRTNIRHAKEKVFLTNYQRTMTMMSGL
jgi:hypothetical protein